MHKITDQQIDFIISDFAKRGVVLEDLRDNLLDHMCCIIENDMTESDDFYQFYETVLPRFFKRNLSEIQIETENLLRFKNFYTMKKIMNITGVLTVILTLLGSIFKTMHWPGAGVMIVSGGALFSLLFLPLLIAIKFRDDNSLKDKIVFSFGLLLGMGLSAGFLFKIMHWPGANVLMISGTVIFTFCYVPAYFITRIKRPELKFNTIVNSVLMFACGGILFAMFNLKNSKSYDDAVSKNHQVLNENTNQLIESNLYLYELQESSSNEGLHLLTDSIIKQADKGVSIVEEEKNNEAIIQVQNDLKGMCKRYNQISSDLKMDKLKAIDYSILNEHHGNLEVHFGEAVSKNCFLRIKQKAAVNENTYLIDQLKN